MVEVFVEGTEGTTDAEPEPDTGGAVEIVGVADLAEEPVSDNVGGEDAAGLTAELGIDDRPTDALVAEDFSAGLMIGGLAGAPGTLVGSVGGFGSALAVEIVDDGIAAALVAEDFSNGLMIGGLAGAPGTLVGSVGVFSVGLVSSTLMVGLSTEACIAGLGFGFEGGKRNSGIFPRFATGSDSLFFGVEGSEVTGDLPGSFATGVSFGIGGGALVILAGSTGTGGGSVFRASAGKCGACNFSVEEAEDLSIKGGTCPDEGATDFSVSLARGRGGGPTGSFIVIAGTVLSDFASGELR